LLTPVSGLTTDPCGTDAGQSHPALEPKLTVPNVRELVTELQVDCDGVTEWKGFGPFRVKSQSERSSNLRCRVERRICKLHHRWFRHCRRSSKFEFLVV
jgi:hypothetical protein